MVFIPAGPAGEAGMQSGRQASEPRLRDIADNLPAVVAYYDASERCGFLNARAQQVLQWLGGGGDSMMLRDVLGPDYATHEPYVRRVLAGEDVRFEGQVRRGGVTVDYATHFVPDRSDDGGVRGFYILSVDQSPLKRAERRSAQVAQSLRTIADNLPVMISYVDREERYVFCNRTYQDWLGVDPQGAVGRKVADVLGEAAYAQRREHLHRALAGERVEFDLVVAPPAGHADGGPRELHVIYLPYHGPRGEVEGIHALMTDVTQAKGVQRQLAYLARTDALTGLANRRAFDEKLQEALARSRRSGRMLALLFLDVDRFKQINDRWGHPVGDEVLQIFSLRLTSCVRETDTVARLAGDEFVVLLEGLRGADEAAAMARKILAAIVQPFELTGEQLLDVRTSIGVACTRTGRIGGEALVAAADQALYAAKAAGRHTFDLIEL